MVKKLKTVSVLSALSYNVIHDLFVLFTFAKAEVLWINILVSDQTFDFIHSSLTLQSQRKKNWPTSVRCCRIKCAIKNVKKS